MKRPLVPTTLAFLLGLVLAYYELMPMGAGLLVALFFLAVVVAMLWWTQARRPAFIALLVAVAGLGALRWEAWETRARERAREARFFSTLDAGRVEGTLLECVSSTERETWRVVHVSSTVGRRSYNFTADALVRMPTETAGTLRPGDRMAWRGGLFPIEASGLPGQPDWPDYYAARNISARLWQRHGMWPETLGHDASLRFRLQGWLFSARTRIAAALARHLSPDNASLALAMVLGECAGWDEARLETLRTSGLFHITSVSGLHVMGLVVGMLWALRRVGLRRRVVAVLALPVITVFVLLVGARAPAVRSGLMAGLLLVGWLLDRETDGLNVLSLAGLLNLLLVPYQMLEAGFQLSYLTVAALILCARLASRWMVPHHPARNYVIAGLTTSTVATAVNTPLLLYHFGRASLLPVFSNALALPLVGVIMPLGALFNFLALAHTPEALLALLAWPLAALLSLLSAIISISGGWSWAVWRSGPLAASTVGFSILFLIVLMAGAPRWPRLAHSRLVAVLLLAALATWTGALADPRRGVMEVQFLSLGQGDATLVHLPFGGTLLVDGGPGDPDDGPSRLLDLLKREGIRRLDLVVLTHPEEDHIGDLPEVLEACSVGAVVTSGKSKPTHVFERFQQTLESRGIPHLVVGRGDRITGLPGVEIAVLSPSRDLLSGPANRASVVLRLDYRDIDFLLTGDVDRTGEQNMLGEHLAMDAEILKVAHHGSRTSSTRDFIAAVHPQLAVVMSGRNSYGHPNRETLTRLEDVGAAVVRTDRAGTVTVRTDGRRYWMETLRSRAIYAGESEEMGTILP